MRVRIHAIEIDEGNVDHITRHGATIAEVEDAFARGTFRRNKGGRTAGYYVSTELVRVNFIYRDGVARPVSAWRY